MRDFWEGSVVGQERFVPKVGERLPGIGPHVAYVCLIFEA